MQAENTRETRVLAREVAHGPALIADSARALMGWSVGTKVGR